MASSSGRRSASSDGSKKRKSVYISGDQTRRTEATPEAKAPVGGRARSTRRGSSQPPALERGAGKAKTPSSGRVKEAAPHRSGRTQPGGDTAAPPKPKRSEGAVRFAETKRDEREQRLASRRTRIRLVLGGVAALIALLLAGSFLLYNSSAFAVGDVVVTGNSRVSGERIVELAAIPPDATLLRLPDAALAARIRTDPWISAVSVGRQFPDKVTVAVTERVPVALVDLGKSRGMWLVDASGSFITTQTKSNAAGLPLVRDVVSNGAAISMKDPPPTMLNALKVLGGMGAQLRSSAKYITAASVDETAVFTKDGVEILFGAATQMVKKDFLARRILADQKGKVVFIDVRSVDRPVWRGLGK